MSATLCGLAWLFTVALAYLVGRLHGEAMVMRLVRDERGQS